MGERDDKQPTGVTQTTKDDDRRSDTSTEAPRGDVDKLALPRTSASSSGAYVAPERVELVADGVGRMAKARVPIAIRAPKGTGPTVRAHADPDHFGVIDGPNILPTTEEVAPHNEFLVRFGAQRAGRYEGTLSLEMQTPGFTNLQVPLTGFTDPSLAPVSVPVERHVPLPAEVDLGEHVVGSDRIYDIAQLRMTEPGTATVRPVEILDPASMQSRVGDDGPLALKQSLAGDFRRSTKEDVRIAQDFRRPLDISFTPTRAGRHEALIEVPITWADNVTTKQYIRVTARARPVTSAPEGGSAEPIPSGPAKSEEDVLNGDPEHDFDFLAETNANLASSHAEKQQTGLEQVAKDTKGYVKRPPEPSILLPLIETALSMANAGLARVFSSTVASVLAADAAKVLRSEAAPALKERAKAELAMIADPIREGFKAKGKQAIGAIKEGMTPAHLASPSLGFFEAQRVALQEKRDVARQTMTRKKFELRPLLKTQPDLALLVQRAAMRGLEAVAANAEHQQKMASFGQYLVAVASSETADPEGLSKRLDYARRFGADNPHNYKDGILRLVIEDGDQANVRGAKLTGISRLALRYLLDAPLASLPIPIIVTVRSRVGEGTITRDPQGVIRAHGTFSFRGKTTDEPNSVERAQELLERVLSVPLARQGLSKIDHDDVGKHEEAER